MKIKIDALKDYDPNKANSTLRMTWIPTVEWNQNLEADEKVTVEIEYLKSATVSEFMITSVNDEGEKETRFDFRKIFKKQVKRINNLEINGYALAKATDVLDFPSCMYTDTLVHNVAAYLISSLSLTGEEIKN